jgi:hypothetical protein
MTVIFKEKVKWLEVVFFQCEISLLHTSGDLEFFYLIPKWEQKVKLKLNSYVDKENNIEKCGLVLRLSVDRKLTLTPISVIWFGIRFLRHGIFPVACKRAHKYEAFFCTKENIMLYSPSH